MRVIKCTAKLQKEMGLKKKDLVAAEQDNAGLGAWHANLIYIDQKKCVLFTNDKTLFHFIVPGVNRNQIKDLASLFRGYLECVLADEGISTQVKEKILYEYREIEYSGTDSKKILGSMNDLAFHYKIRISDEGGIHSHKVPEIIKQLNRMPMGTIKYKYPVELLKTVCEEII